MGADIEAAIRADLDAGKSIIATAKKHGVGTSVVQRVKTGTGKAQHVDTMPASSVSSALPKSKNRQEEV